MIVLLSTLSAAFAIDVNDQLRIEMAGGEAIEGCFVRGQPEVFSLHVPNLGRSVDIYLNMVHSVAKNGQPMELDEFVVELGDWQSEWERWLANTPIPPPPLAVAFASVPLAGTGHALLGDWRAASGMMVADALGMGVMTWELKNNQRLNVVSGALAVSLVMKFYSATNGARKARTFRRRRGEDNVR